MNQKPCSIFAGAAEADITPRSPMHLFGYPGVDRISTGVHDRLMSSALYLDDGSSRVLFIANDLIWLPKLRTDRIRRNIEKSTGIPAGHIMVTATHTHSGPITSEMLCVEDDPHVPPPDERWLMGVEDGIVAAARAAVDTAEPATLALAIADGSELGTNRRHPDGPANPKMPLLAARSKATGKPLAAMIVCSMHPTVLHEDWTLVSGDFPGLARMELRRRGQLTCPMVYHMGTSGNQSPRHVVKANTIDEALRLGHLLADAVIDGMARAEPIEQPVLTVNRAFIDLPLREMPSVEAAQRGVDAAEQRYRSLKENDAPKTAIRTAECDTFGANETLTLAKAAANGRIQQAASTCLPAEVQAIGIGPHTFVGWPGEVFVEFALAVRKRYPNAWIITLANGDLQVYLVTQDAIDENAYEAGNAIFASPESGQRLVTVTTSLLE